jgi:glycine/D-amino acid oxidase-like deaminating enzyme
MTVDYLIIGQGICGTFLSRALLKKGKKVLVIDEPRPFSSTKVASGVINPVTGRRMVKTWMIDELLPFAEREYTQFSQELGVELMKQSDLLMFHPTLQMQTAFEERYNADKEYLEKESSEAWKQYFHFNYGIGKVTSCLLVDLNSMLDKWRAYLKKEGSLIEENFDNELLSFDDSSVIYRNITAEKIIFCNGTDAFQLPYFHLLPYAKNKGEVIIAAIPGLPAGNIYKQGLTIVPWKNDLFWIGSSYEWEFADLQPTERFRRRTEEQLKSWLKLPFTIVDHMAAERPATLERRPFVGIHPVHSSIGIFNGMGTKGCSLAPYFAAALARHLVYNQPITPEADVQRFKRILSKGIH